MASQRSRGPVRFDSQRRSTDADHTSTRVPGYVHRSVTIVLSFVLCANVSAASAIHSATIDRDPFGYREADGTPAGISVDIYRLVGARLGRTVDVEFANAPQIAAGVLQGHIDLAVMFEHPELDPAAVAVGPVLEVPTGVLTRTPLAHYEDLSGLRIGYVQATPFDDRFDADTALTKIAFANVHDAFSAYVAGSIDAIAGPLQYLFYQAPEYAARTGTLFHVLPLQIRHMWLYVRTAAFTDSERAAIVTAIQQMQEANMVESFSARYLARRVNTQ
jgi:ABC-type amino acid transport substrate-binding protein